MKPATSIDTIPNPSWAAADDSALLRAALGRDDLAWREFVKRFDLPLREVIRYAASATAHPLDPDEIDDVMGDFWVLLLEGDRRVLRAFNPLHGASLQTWLTFHVAQVAYEHVHRAAREPKFVSLRQARNVADSRPLPDPRLRNESAGTIDAAIRECVRSAIVQVVREELTADKREREAVEADKPRSAAWWAQQLGCSAESLVKRVRRGTLEATRIGCRFYFTKAQIDGSRRWQRAKRGGSHAA